MAGRIIVDGRSPIDELVYGASSNDRWIRFGIEFDQGFLAITDPRRFSRVAASRVHDDLGPDAFNPDLCDVVRRHLPKRGNINGVLLNQGVIAGFGNMLVDEVLSRSRVDPRRDIATMKPQLIEKVFGTVVSVLPELLDWEEVTLVIWRPNCESRGRVVPTMDTSWLGPRWRAGPHTGVLTIRSEILL